MEKIRKKQKIADLRKDDIVNDIFFVKFRKPVEKYKNGYKFELKVGDSTGELMLKYWGSENEGEVKNIYDAVKRGDIIHITGRVNEWNDRLEISLNKDSLIRRLSPEEYSINDFVKATEKDVDGMFNEILKLVESIKDESYKKILEKFFSDEDFVKGFKQCPASMYLHHGWIGGLLEHVLNVVNICDFIIKLHPSLNRDLLITGALLHDIGKLEEFSITSHIKVTNKGILIGHVTIGAQMLEKALYNTDTPEEYKLKVMHMILSHHGKLEFGSPKIPAFPEALALYHADELDARLHMMSTAKENAVTEDDYVYTKEFGNVYLR